MGGGLPQYCTGGGGGTSARSRVAARHPHPASSWRAVPGAELRSVIRCALESIGIGQRSRTSFQGKREVLGVAGKARLVISFLI